MANYNLGSVQGNLKIDYDGSGVKEAKSDVEKAKAAIGNGNLKIKLDADATRLEQEIQKAEADIAGLKSQHPTVEVEANIARAESNLKQLEGQLNRVNAERVEATVDANTSPADSKLKQFGDKAKGVGAAAGLGAGAALSGGIAGSISLEASNAKLTAQLGLSKDEAARIGKISGKVFGEGFGESKVEVNNALVAIKANFGDLGQFSSQELEGMTKSALNLASTFDVDVNGATRAAGQLVKTGLAPNFQTAFDIIGKGFQEGANASDDFLDTITEYSVQFDGLGLNAQTATGILTQGMQAGARSTDLVADALKEFNIRAVDGSESTAEGFKLLGLNGAEMSSKIAAGGPPAQAALDQVFDALRNIKDPAQRSAAAVALFGTQSEDMQQALLAIDPSAASDSMQGFDGTMGRINDTLEDTAARKLESAKRQFQQFTTSLVGTSGPIGDVSAGLVAMGPDVLTAGAAFTQLGFTAGPALSGIASKVKLPEGGIKKLASSAVESATSIRGSTGRMGKSFGTVAGKAGTAAGGAAKSAGTMATAFASTAAKAVAATVTIVAQLVKQAAQWGLMAAKATTGAIRTAAAWLITTGVNAATSLASMIAYGVKFAAQWALMAAQAVAKAAIIALAWLAANPIALIIIALIAIVAVIVYYWDDIVAFLTGVWEWIKQTAVAVWQGIVNFFTTLWTGYMAFITSIWTTILTFLITLWQNIWNTATTVWNGILNFFSTVLSGIANFFTTVWNGIVSFVTGLWSGLVNTASTIFNGLVNLISTILNGIANFFTTVWNSIVAFVTGLWNGLVNTASSVFNGMLNTISNILNSIGNFFRSAWNGIVNFVGTAWNNIVNAVSSGISNVLGFMSALPGRILSAVGNLASLLYNAGRDVVIGLWNGIQALGSWIYNNILSWVRSVVPGPVLQFLGIASPSRYFRDEVGKQIPAGIAGGIEDNSKVAANAAEMLAKGVGDSATKATAASLSKSVGVDLGKLSPELRDRLSSMAVSLGSSGVAANPGLIAGAAGLSSNDNNSKTISVGNLTLQITGNLDPTKPTQWRAAIEEIRDGIRDVERSNA